MSAEDKKDLESYTTMLRESHSSAEIKFMLETILSMIPNDAQLGSYIRHAFLK